MTATLTMGKTTAAQVQISGIHEASESIQYPGHLRQRWFMKVLENQGIFMRLLAEISLGYFHMLVIKRLHSRSFIYL